MSVVMEKNITYYCKKLKHKDVYADMLVHFICSVLEEAKSCRKDLAPSFDDVFKVQYMIYITFVEHRK